jgi:predicted amidohydrolase YtcJ
MAAARPRAEAIAVSEGKIVAVGSRDELLSRVGRSTRVVDFGDRCLVPGFVDPHVHSAFASLRDWVDVGPFTTPTLEAARERIAQAASQAKPGGWVQAKMLDPSLQLGDPVTLKALDQLTHDRAVFVVESNGHVAYANSLAFELAGVGPDTPDPPQGRYGRDAAGRLTGRIEETPAFAPFISVMPQPTQEQLIEMMSADFQDAIARGCTTVNDAGVGNVFGMGDLSLLDRVVEGGLPLRIGAFLVATLFDEWTAAGLAPGERESGVYITGIKGWADGSNQARTGFMREPYLGTDSRGALNYSPAEIAKVVRRAAEGGWPIGVHANGDAAIDVALDALEQVAAINKSGDLRPRLEHCSILHPEQIARMADLGVSPSFLIGHVHYWGRAFRNRLVGPERALLLDPCASAVEAGLRISLHSDFNVTPMDPLRCISNAVLRDMRDGGDILNARERLTAVQAFRAMTIDAAWQCHLDHVCGSLEVGKSADFVALEQDPFTEPAEAIAELGIKSTWFRGQQSFGA